MDYSRVLLSTDLQSIQPGSCVSWPGLLRITWPRSCLGTSWRVEMVVPNSAANCFSSLLSSTRKLSRLMVRMLGSIDYGFVPIQPHLLGAVGWYLPSSHFDALTLTCLPGWTCILYLRSLLCSLILLVYPGTSTLALLPRICVSSNYCCPVYCVSSALTMKWMPLFWFISHFCCPFPCLSSLVPHVQALSLIWWVCVGRKFLLYPSFNRLCIQCLVHLFRWLLIPPYLGELTLSYMMRLLMPFSGAGGELCLYWVIPLLLLSLCMVFQFCCYSGVGSMLLYNGLPRCFDSGYCRPLSCITLCFVLQLTMAVSCSGSGKGVIWGFYLCLVHLKSLTLFTRLILTFSCCILVSKSTKSTVLDGNLILTCHFALVFLAGNCLLNDYGPCVLHCISLVLCDLFIFFFRLEPNWFTLCETVSDWLWWEGFCPSHPCSQRPCRSPYLLFDPNQHAMMFRMPDGMVANLHGGWFFNFLMRIFSSPIATWVALFVFWGLPLYLIPIHMRNSQPPAKAGPQRIMLRGS